MKNNLSIIVAIIILCYVCQALIGLPWWSVFVVSLVVLYLSQKKEYTAALLGFVSIFVFWSVTAGLIDMGNDSILSSQIANLFGGIGSIGLILMTGLIGGIIGAIGAWTGSILSRLLQKQSLSNF